MGVIPEQDEAWMKLLVMERNTKQNYDKETKAVEHNLKLAAHLKKVDSRPIQVGDSFVFLIPPLPSFLVQSLL